MVARLGVLGGATSLCVLTTVRTVLEVLVLEDREGVSLTPWPRTWALAGLRAFPCFDSVTVNSGPSPISLPHGEPTPGVEEGEGCRLP